MAQAKVNTGILSYPSSGGTKAGLKAFIRPSDLGARPSRTLQPLRRLLPGKRDSKPHLLIWSGKETLQSQVSKAYSKPMVYSFNLKTPRNS